MPAHAGSGTPRFYLAGLAINHQAVEIFAQRTENMDIGFVERVKFLPNIRKARPFPGNAAGGQSGQ
jgi:hypothetical protein